MWRLSRWAVSLRLLSLLCRCLQGVRGLPSGIIQDWMLWIGWGELPALHQMRAAPVCIFALQRSRRWPVQCLLIAASVRRRRIPEGVWKRGSRRVCFLPSNPARVLQDRVYGRVGWVFS